ncbi:MAG: hypothetical protein GF398_19385 [Chitinivibrionales bacterium]|nr:hypothetical protein [Chitinivibrionales bacterium]
MMNKLGLFVPVVLCLSLLSFAQEVLEAEGTGLGANRDEALLAAKRDAVEKGVGTMLLSQTEIENFMVKRDNILTNTQGYVKSFEIISEMPTADNLIQMHIKAVLARSAIHKDLAAALILIESMNKPKVMVIVQENNVGNEEPTNQAAEIALIGFLKDPYGFEVVDPSMVQSIKASQQKMAQVAGNAAEAAAIGSRFGAEVVVTGQAVSRVAEGMSKNLGGMVSVQCDVSLRAVNCATGRVVGTANGHAAKVHIAPTTAGNQGITKAAQKAGAKLLDNIMKDWSGQLNNGIPLSVSIKGVPNFRIRNGVLSALKGVAGVTSVRERNWDGQSKLLQTDIQYKGNANGFCTKIDGYKLSTGGSLSVGGIEGNRVRLVAQVM